MQQRHATEADIGALTELWEACGLARPYNAPDRDIRFALAHPEATILVFEDDGGLAASVLAGHNGHRSYVYHVGVHPRHQGTGLGRKIMTVAEDWLRSRGVWKLNLMVRESNAPVQSFYEAIGYERQPRIVMTKWLEEAPGEMLD